MPSHDFLIFRKLLKTFLRFIRDTQGHNTGPGESSGDLSKHHECPYDRAGGTTIALIIHANNENIGKSSKISKNR